jgi:hypothetical protein
MDFTRRKLGPVYHVAEAITAFPPYVDAPKCTLFYVLRHVSICVDLRLRPAMYVYTDVGVHAATSGYAVSATYVYVRQHRRCT